MKHSAYDTDYCEWVQHQIALLASRQFDKFDIGHLTEELGEMGNTARNEIESRLTVLLAHWLKLQFQPEQLIGKIDGSMMPVVETAAAEERNPKVDRRKTRRVCWKEARLTLVHEPGAVTPVFGATVGAYEEAGRELLRAAVQAGLGR